MTAARTLAELFGFDACCLDDRRPTCDLALDQGSKRLRAAFCLIGNVAPEFEQALAHALVVERFVERISELVEDWLRCPLRRKQRVPGRCLEFRQAGFLCGRNIRQGRTARGSADCITLDQAALNL